MSVPDRPMTKPFHPDRRIFDDSTDLLCVRDMQGRIVRVNQAWETTLGLSIAEVTAKPLLPLVHPADVPATLTRMAEVDRSDQVGSFVNRYRRRDGRYRYMDWQAQRVGDVILGRARDITDQRLRDDKLRIASEALEETLADISLSIRIPSDTILAALEALRQTEPTHAQLVLAQRIGRSVQTLQHLVSALIEREKNAAWAMLAGSIERDQVHDGLPLGRPNRRDRAEPATKSVATCPLPAGPAGSVEAWVLEMLEFLDGNPVYDRNFQDVTSQVLGFLSIGLEHRGNLYPRQLLGLSGKSGLMSAGRASALLARMQDIGFVDVAGEFRAGQIRRYRVLPPMKRAFIGQVMVHLKSLAPDAYRALLALEKIEKDPTWATHLLAAFAECLLQDHTSRKGSPGGQLNGVPLMAKGLPIALSIASNAAVKHGPTWEGWIELALTTYARRFDVSRVHVRRIITSLEPCGLHRDPASPSRLLVTDRFREEIAAYRAATCNLLTGVLERLV